MSDDDDDDLFTYNPRARATDPDTSAEAVESIDVSKQALLVLKAYVLAGRDLMDWEAYRLAGFPPGRTSHQRCSDLRHKGHIERTDHKGRTPSNKAAYYCRLTEQGRAYFRENYI